MGDTIVKKGKIYTYNGIILSNRIEVGDGVFLGPKVTIEPQKLKAKFHNTEWIYFYGENVTGYSLGLGTQIITGGLKVSKKNKHNVKVFGVWRNEFTHTLKQKPDITFTKITAFEKPNFKQELIYNGRSGDNVKFLYRELSGGMMRAPFQQEVQYDLNEGNIIGFKSVRIEIIKADNVNLQYRVLKSFPDSF